MKERMREQMREQMRKLIMVLAMVFVAVLVFPLNVHADTQVGANTGTLWTTGKYNVNSDVTINERIVISGDVILNLNSGTLTALKGISAQDGSSLTINGTNGTLKATGAYHCAGIGGASEIKSGTIIINGGTIIAEGGDEAAGIGGGYKADSAGEIKITGGNVTARSGLGAAGIGGGCKGTNGSITITGGVINAYGWAGGAGIGSGSQKDNGPIDIIGSDVNDRNKCLVNASVREYRNYCGAAGIGCGDSANCTNNITIKNATVNAISTSGLGSSDFDGAGIGAGSSSQTFGVAGDMKATITIENAYVASTGGHEGGAGIGAGFGGDMSGTVRIKNSTVKAGGGLGAAGIGGGRERARTRYGGAGGTVYIEGDSDVIALGGRSEELPGLGCSAIGHGSDDKVMGHIYIDSGLMVEAGNSLKEGDEMINSERTFTAFEREGACMYRYFAHIARCLHGHDITYTKITESTHTQDTCKYCGQTFKAEEHKFVNGLCEDCGYQETNYTVTFKYGYQSLEIPVSQNKQIQLPWPDDLEFEASSGYAFDGKWKINNTTILSAGETLSITGNLEAEAQVVEAYPLWVGGVQVSPANYSNIMGDGGNPTVVYDNATKTLTLNGAKITGRYKFGSGNSYSGIYSELESLTIKVKGDNIVNPYSGKDTDQVYGIYAKNASANNGIIIKGIDTNGEKASLSASGNYAGIYLDGKLETENVEIAAVADEKVGGSYGINAGSIEVKSGILEARGNTAIHYNTSFGWDTSTSKLGITEPMGGTNTDNTIKAGSSTAKRVVISEDGYPIWVGGVQVTSYNYNTGVLLGGTASFDPVGKMLVFSRSPEEITGSGYGTNNDIDAIIYSELDTLTIVAPNGGSGALTLNAPNMKTGIYSGGSLVLKGSNITIKAKNTAIDAGSITTNGNLDVTTSGDEDSYLISSGGDITVDGALKGQSKSAGVEAYGNVKVTGDLSLAAAGETLLDAWEDIEIGGNVSTTGNTTKDGFISSGTITKKNSTKVWNIITSGEGAAAMKAYDIIIPATNVIKEGDYLCRISSEAPKTVMNTSSDTVAKSVVIQTGESGGGGGVTPVPAPTVEPEPTPTGKPEPTPTAQPIEGVDPVAENPAKDIDPSADVTSDKTADESTRTTETTTDETTGTVTETTSVTNTDGSTTETVKEKKPDGSVTQTTTVTEKSGEKTTQVQEENTDGSKKEAVTIVAGDETGDYQSKEVETNTSGKTKTVAESHVTDTTAQTIATAKSTIEFDGSTVEVSRVEKTDGTGDYKETYEARDATGNVVATRETEQTTIGDIVKETNKEVTTEGTTESEKSTRANGDFTSQKTVRDATGALVSETEVSKVTAEDGTAEEIGKETSASGESREYVLNTSASGAPTEFKELYTEAGDVVYAGSYTISGKEASVESLLTVSDILTVLDSIVLPDETVIPVTAITEDAIREVTEVIISEGIKKIETGAFADSKAKSITFLGGISKKEAKSMFAKNCLEGAGSGKKGKGLTIYGNSKKDVKQIKRMLKKAGVPKAKVKVAK